MMVLGFRLYTCSKTFNDFLVEKEPHQFKFTWRPLNVDKKDEGHFHDSEVKQGHLVKLFLRTACSN